MTEPSEPRAGLVEPADPAALARLHTRLEAAAASAALLDIAYRTVDSPLGPLLLAATPAGLVRVAYAVEDHDQVLGTLADRLSPRVLRSPGRLDEAARQVEEYLAGRRRRFELPLDWSLTSGFRAIVQHRLPAIDYGRTVGYGELARLVGRPRAARAVGTACATNPLPIVVPCHRVLRSDGRLGGYVGGLAAKEELLRLERDDG